MFVCNSSVSFFLFCWFFQLEILKTGCGWYFFLYIYVTKEYIFVLYTTSICTVRSYYDEKHKDAKSSRRSFVFCSSLKSVDFSFHFSIFFIFIFLVEEEKFFLLLLFHGKEFRREDVVSENVFTTFRMGFEVIEVGCALWIVLKKNFFFIFLFIFSFTLYLMIKKKEKKIVCKQKAKIFLNVNNLYLDALRDKQVIKVYYYWSDVNFY